MFLLFRLQRNGEEPRESLLLYDKKNIIFAVWWRVTTNFRVGAGTLREHIFCIEPFTPNGFRQERMYEKK